MDKKQNDESTSNNKELVTTTTTTMGEPRQVSPTIAAPTDAEDTFKLLPFAQISNFFNMRLEDACKQVEITTTNMKKICRHYHIQRYINMLPDILYRWPYRKLKSLQARREKLLQENSITRNEELQEIEREVQNLYSPIYYERITKKAKPKAPTIIPKAILHPASPLYNMAAASVSTLDATHLRVSPTIVKPKKVAPQQQQQQANTGSPVSPQVVLKRTTMHIGESSAFVPIQQRNIGVDANPLQKSPTTPSSSNPPMNTNNSAIITPPSPIGNNNTSTTPNASANNALPSFSSLVNSLNKNVQ